MHIDSELFARQVRRYLSPRVLEGEVKCHGVADRVRKALPAEVLLERRQRLARRFRQDTGVPTLQRRPEIAPLNERPEFAQLSEERASKCQCLRELSLDNPRWTRRQVRTNRYQLVENSDLIEGERQCHEQ